MLHYYSYLDSIPILPGERVDGLLLEALLALGQSLVPVIKVHPSASLSPFTFRNRNVVPWGTRASVLKPGQLTHLPTAIFAKSRSQRWSGVVGRGGWVGRRSRVWKSIRVSLLQVRPSKNSEWEAACGVGPCAQLAPSRADGWSVPSR